MPSEVHTRSWQSRWRQLAHQSLADTVLHTRLMADPELVLQEMGIELPEHVELHVVDDTIVPHMLIPAICASDTLVWEGYHRTADDNAAEIRNVRKQYIQENHSGPELIPGGAAR